MSTHSFLDSQHSIHAKCSCKQLHAPYYRVSKTLTLELSLHLAEINLTLFRGKEKWNVLPVGLIRRFPSVPNKVRTRRQFTQRAFGWSILRSTPYSVFLELGLVSFRSEVRKFYMDRTSHGGTQIGWAGGDDAVRR